MEVDSGLFNSLLTWGAPLLRLTIAVLAFQRGKQESGFFVGLAAVAAFLQPVLFYTGYGLPTDWIVQQEALTWHQWVGWIGEYVLPVVSMLGLVFGYGLLLRRP